MKKLLLLFLPTVICLACGCTEKNENTDTQFLFDTVVTLTADCDDKTLESAFELCRNYEKLLSRSVKDSDVCKLNNASDGCKVSGDTVKIIEKAIYYGDLSNGKFDITIYPVSKLWDFNSDVVPSRDEIAEALKNVDYHSITIDGNTVCTNGKQIDLGGIAKGYIADRVLEYFKQNKVDSGIINLGGNIIVWGDEEYTLGIKKPFSQNDIIASVMLKNKSVVTSGVYERYIRQGDTLYHHILDTKTGYACDTNLYSATVIGDSSIDCDALSTVCILLGLDDAKALIENTKNVEAIFVNNNNQVYYTSGLTKNDNVFCLK